MQKKCNLPHTRFWGWRYFCVRGCCLSHLLFLTEGVTEEKLTVLSIFNHWLQQWLFMFLNKCFRLHFFLAVSTFICRIPSFSVDPEDHWDCHSRSSMSQWSACGSTTVCSQWLVAEEVRVDGSLSILIVIWWTTWQGSCLADHDHCFVF